MLDPSEYEEMPPSSPLWNHGAPKKQDRAGLWLVQGTHQATEKSEPSPMVAKARRYMSRNLSDPWHIFTRFEHAAGIFRTSLPIQ